MLKARRARGLLLTCSIACGAALVPGCFAHVEDTCPACTIVRHDMPLPPAVPAGQRGLVILLHGAFGFGNEWRPVTEALARRPELSWYAFSWPGPFGNKVPERAEEFRVMLQHAVDTLPPSAREVLVLAHSAGGPVADYAARALVVPVGVRVHVAKLDAARISLMPYTMSPEVDTPLGLALGAAQDPSPPIPRGVEIGDYRANNAPKRLRTRPNARLPKEVGVVSSDGESVTYLGRRVSHGGAVALVALPLIERLGRSSPP